MKSNQEQLANRGYLKEGIDEIYPTLSFENKLKLLRSKVATERTLGARLLCKVKEPVVGELVQALRLEEKLYPKIEICKALVSHREASIKPLIAELGKIGSNQHHSIPAKEFGKGSYPLPRDIAARTLAHIGKSALPELVKCLSSNNGKQINEAIDAIGFICFYDFQSGVCEELVQCYKQNRQSELTVWKIIRAMSSFSESKDFLLEQRRVLDNERIQKEISRSLTLIENWKTESD